ncbi:hypothetical protein HYW66_01030, partial [Candidatus Microgenomates bacterium]|nr:hypothetical protein [Candidatus Microgenomates bacterium]
MKWEDAYRLREKLLPILLIGGTLLLTGRLFFLQIIKGGEYRSLANSNRIKEEIIHAPRGIIYDRNGYPLVRNLPGFRIRIASPAGELLRVISQEEALRLAMKDNPTLEIDTLREYLYPEEFAHVLGYLGEDNKTANIGGKAGLEESYNSQLLGVDGKRLIEVDAARRTLRELGKQEGTSGQDLKTTLDLPLQKKAYSAMEEVERGALVASDPRSGEILALVSKPSFDPNLFTLGEGYREASEEGKLKTVAEIFNDPDQPLFNRVISGTYPPGSTFKIITAAAALEEKVISKDTQIEDIGILRIGAFSFPNWYFLQYGKLEGLLNIVGAIKRSNDIFFYKLAEMVGIEKLEEMAKKFGLAATLGIDIRGEAAGLFPSDVWKQEAIGDKWYLGDTYHIGIGQGYLLTTPLQMNAWTQVVANGGTLYQPRLVKNITNTTNTTNNPIIKSQNFLKKETIELIREGMREA